MSNYHRLEVSLHNALIQTNDKTPPYRVIDNMELYIGIYGGYYRFRVFLAEESREALNNRNFNKFKRHYNYELITGGDMTVVAKGQVHRCGSYESIHRRRVVRDYNQHIVVNELLHEAIGSLVLCNIEQYDSSSHEMCFFDAVRKHTPYASGAGKSGPINSPRFVMCMGSGIDDLHGRRRFSTERTPEGDVEINGIYTTWTYGEAVADQPKIMYTNHALVTQEAYDPRSFEFGMGGTKIPPKLCQPATVNEVLEQFKKVVVPTTES